jgi:hypothetical protein
MPVCAPLGMKSSRLGGPVVELVSLGELDARRLHDQPDLRVVTGLDVRFRQRVGHGTLEVEEVHEAVGAVFAEHDRAVAVRG